MVSATRRVASQAMSQMMRAVIIDNGVGPSSALRLSSVEAPRLEASKHDDSLLVKVKAFALNRMDIMQREGKYPIPQDASKILGVEYAGEVVDAGAHVHSLRVGDPVMGLCSGGTYAEYVRVPACLSWKKSEKLSWEQAASIPEAYLTALQALQVLNSQQPGDHVLVHAGASGVGLAAIQLARFLGAEKVYVTAGSAEKIQVCKSLGANDGFNYKQTDWYESLMQATEKRGVDVILDFIGAPYFEKNLRSLRLDGRLSMQALMGGDALPQGTKLGRLLTHRLRVTGSTLRSRSLAYQAQLAEQFVQCGALEALARGADGSTGADCLQTVLHCVYDWHDIRAAHDEMEANKNIGKIVATLS
ncbi:hypothetical protein MNAN1_000143 [Malassezia nana]|uniref:Enoyl reductase (ER) domain-containing protein n=1 Tax=Malassezia nana TaxID=180528 RepID=A0AAF0J0V3_9BASI|nr:hypothetical protein MNAN1_000143 [Malassezia nana]